MLRPSSTHSSISEGGISNDRLASATVVFPWMISITSAVLRLAVQRLNSYSITLLIFDFLSRLFTEQVFSGSLHTLIARRLHGQKWFDE